MELDFYLWKYKIKNKDFAEDVDIGPSHFSMIKRRKISPCLMHAIRIHEHTKGKVTFREMLKEIELENL